MAQQSSPLSLRGDSSADRSDWERAVADVLRKSGKFKDGDDPAGAPAALTKSTSDGIAIAPLAGPEVSAGLATSTSGSVAVRGKTRASSEPGETPAWDLRVFLTDPAIKPVGELEGGANSLWISTREGAIDDLDAALKDVLLDIAPIVLDSADPIADGTKLTSKGTLDPRSNLGADPTADWLLSGSAPAYDLAAIAKLAQDAGIKAFVVDASVVHDAGAGDVLELGFMAASAVGLLRKLDEAGINATDAAALIDFRYAATDQQFTTIAKLRAARAIWARVAQVLEVADDVQTQHVVTSSRMMTRFDPWTNLLRTTIATFAAAVGGADAITVAPYDAAIGKSDEFGYRMARHISNLLVHESHIGQVTDPAGGTGSIEKLTDDLARAGWAKFTEIEAAGGIDTYIESGALASDLAAVTERRNAAIAKRKQPITGVSEFPLSGEELLPREAGYSRFTSAALITPVRDSDGFEQLRTTPTSTPVFLWPIGSLAATTARSGFATNLLTAGGIGIVAGTPGADFEAIKAEYDASGAKVVCLVGSDDGYSNAGPDTIGQLRAAGVTHIVSAGKPVAEIADLIDDYMAAGQDVLDFLRRTRTTMEDKA